MVSISNFYKHQKDYYNVLKYYSDNNEKIKSIICIPTGGGKTRLAVTYAINCVLEKNGKILWLAQSRYLLDQAYSTFEELWGSNNVTNYLKKIYSGADSISDVNSNTKVIIGSYLSLKDKKWQFILGDDVTIIVDETHHIIAENYMDIIKGYCDDKTVLGLSATPIRSDEKESLKLYEFYKDTEKINVNVSLTSLLKEGILVNPKFEEAMYEINSQKINDIETANLELKKDIDRYNKLILEQYDNNKERYGKTVIFAIDKEHVDSLYSLFKSKYQNDVYRVYSGLFNKDLEFENFKKSNKGILINVNIMSEGVDIPDIKTIFLTKQLNSKIAATQIAGRALRVPKNVKKDCAYIVNFAVSNLGKKILLVNPKIEYNLYQAIWDNDVQKQKGIQLMSKALYKLSQIVIDMKTRKKSTCSFSDICLVGYYTIINEDNEDIILPVSLKEYRKIELYMKNKQSGKIKFPRKLFFNSNSEILKKYFDDSKINNNINIMFDKISEEGLENYEKVLSEIEGIYRIVVNNNLNKKEIDKIICDEYNNIKQNQVKNNELLYLLGNLGINNEKDFTNLVRLEFVSIKNNIKE